MNLAYNRVRKILRRIVLAGLLVFIAVLVQVVAVNLLKKNEPPPVSPRSLDQAVTFQEKFQALEFSGQKRSVSLKAEKFYLDEAQNQHLEGQVVIIDEELTERAVLKADKVVIEQDKKKIKAESGVEVNLGDLQIKAPALEYDLEQKTVKSAQTQVTTENLSILTGTGLHCSKQAGNF